MWSNKTSALHFQWKPAATQLEEDFTLLLHFTFLLRMNSTGSSREKSGRERAVLSFHFYFLSSFSFLSYWPAEKVPSNKKDKLNKGTGTYTVHTVHKTSFAHNLFLMRLYIPYTSTRRWRHAFSVEWVSSESSIKKREYYPLFRSGKHNRGGGFQYGNRQQKTKTFFFDIKLINKFKQKMMFKNIMIAQCSINQDCWTVYVANCL